MRTNLENQERFASMTNTNDAPRSGGPAAGGHGGASPDKIGVYSTSGDTVTSGSSTTSSKAADMAGDVNRRASAATASSPARWIIPIVVVVLIIVALFYLS
jgi:hypothetical protein